MVIGKEALRAEYKKQLQLLPEQDRQEQSKAIAARLSLFLKEQSGTWALFCPLVDEPNLIGLLDSCPHIQWVFPKVLSKTSMAFYKVLNRETMVASSWGICEPGDDSIEPTPGSAIDGCIVPGIAFDRMGCRLGRGGDYYDRFLQDFKGLKLGVTFRQALAIQGLPSESHDQRMNHVVSADDWIAMEHIELK